MRSKTSKLANPPARCFGGQGRHEGTKKGTKMIEVFKTNVNDTAQAERLVGRIHRSFPGYEANFDLEDCDRILRVKCEDGIVVSGLIIELMRSEGFSVEILCDEILEVIP